MAKQAQPKRVADPTEAEIVEALESSGYPLELRLRRILAANGFNPILGSWLATSAGGADLREIDLQIQKGTHCELAGMHAYVGIYGFIAVKKLQPEHAFVGILQDADAGGRVDVSRVSFAGIPAWPGTHNRGTAGFDALFRGSQGSVGLADAVSNTLLTGEICVHWAVVRRERGGGFRAGGDTNDSRYFSAMSSVVRAAYWHDVEWTRHCEKTSAQIDLRVTIPTLLVETENMYVYDDVTKAVRKVNSLLLLQTFDAGSDRITYRPLSIRRVSALEDLAHRYERAIEQLSDSVQRYLPYLFRYAEKLSSNVSAKLDEDD